jgi:diphthamide biosynthesis methyltransferase
MVLYVVGLGLGDEQDVTLRGLNAIKKSKKVFLENYTSVLGVELDKLVRSPFLPAASRHTRNPVDPCPCRASSTAAR